MIDGFRRVGQIVHVMKKSKPNPAVSVSNFPPSLLRIVKRMAISNNRSVAAQIIAFVKQCVKGY